MRIPQILAILGLLAACGAPDAALPAAPRATPVIRHDIARLLENLPVPGVTVELDAYYGGASGLILNPSEPSTCMTVHGRWLTDQPVPGYLRVLNHSAINENPVGIPHIAVGLGGQAPSIPYHARLRGHLLDLEQHGCLRSRPIIMIDAVLETYQELPDEYATFGVLDPPADFAGWPRYHDPFLGYRLPYPPEAQIETVDIEGALAALRVTLPDWPEHPIWLEMMNGETHADPYASEFDRQFAPFLQGDIYTPLAGAQNLAGSYIGDHTSTAEVFFGAHGRSYALVLSYPTGIDASQRLLTVYNLMVAGFQLDVAPGPTPVSPIKQAIGAGPLIGQEEAFQIARKEVGPPAQLLDARLISEAQARAELPRSCGGFRGHPDGVWRLEVYGVIDNAYIGTLFTYLNASTGRLLCSTGAIDPSAPTLTPTIVPTAPPEFDPAQITYLPTQIPFSAYPEPSIPTREVVPGVGTVTLTPYPLPAYPPPGSVTPEPRVVTMAVPTYIPPITPTLTPVAP